MKRILIISLVLITIFSLSACKKTSDLTLDIESDFLGSTYNSDVEANTDESESTVSEEVNSVTDEEASHDQSNTAPNKRDELFREDSKFECSSEHGCVGVYASRGEWLRVFVPFAEKIEELLQMLGFDRSQFALANGVFLYSTHHSLV